MIRVWRLLLAALVGAAAWAPGFVRACAVCNVGDQTITSMGTEKPYRGRLRPSLQLQHRTDAVGEERVDRLELRELRLDASLAWAPHERLFVTGTMPVLRREVTYVNLARRTTHGPGDAEVRAKYFLWQDRGYGARHLVALLAGVKLPTGAVQRGPGGEALPVELQPGTGSVDPLAGLSYAHFAWPWSFYTSLQLFASTAGTDGMRASRSVRTTTAAQWQASSALGLRLGFDGRLDGKALEGGEIERDSGGFIGFLSPEVLLSPAQDWMVLLSVRVPVIQALLGFHREGPILSLAVARDL